MIAAWLALSCVLSAPPPEAGAVVPPSLESALDLPAALPMRRDTRAQVVLTFTVGVDGRASDIEVVRSPSRALGDVAVTAIGKARFRPATQGGTPTPVRITVPVDLGGGSMLSGQPRRGVEAPPLSAAGVRGVVLERGTRRPVPGLGVTLDGVNPIETVTDEQGRFSFPELPVGSYDVIVPFFDEPGAKRRVRLTAEGGPDPLTLRITPGRLGEYVTRVNDDRERLSNPARIEVPVERAREVPGSNGDPLKVLESLPGVARPAAAGPGAGALVIRGAAPEDSRFYIDGLPLFQLYHFGNIFSVVQDEWIGNIDYRPGGYSTQFGDAIGGMVNVTLKDLPRDGVHGHGDANIYHLAGLVTVPVSDEWTLGVAARRSWVDAILGSIVGSEDGFRFTTAPRYYDYQVRADHHPESGAKVRLLAFGSDDDLVAFGGAPGANDLDANNFRLSRSFHQVQGTMQLALARDLFFTAGLATSYQRLRVSPGSNDLQITFDPLIGQADLEWRPSRAIRLKGGVYGEVQRFKVVARVPLPTAEGQVALPSEVQRVFDVTENGFSGRADLWGEASFEISPVLNALAGLRLQTWHGNFDAVAPDARAAIGWTPDPEFAVTLAGGVNHQDPSPDESARSIGSSNLLPERAAYMNLGVVKRFGSLLSVEVQGFWKELDQLIVRTTESGGGPYDNAGTGRIVGAEALVRLQHPVIDAWVAYTLSRSRRVDRPGQPERFFSFDQTHVLALVAGVQLGAGWRLGTRLRYATGNPFTPLEPAYFDAGADVWVPRAATDPLAARSGDFFQLDLRVDKTFIFDAWRLDLYLELNNATNRANIESVQYSDDFRRREDITSLPLTPSIGIRGSF